MTSRSQWIPQNAWTTVPGTGLQVYSYADKPIRVGTDEEGSLAVRAGQAWLPRFCTVIIRKEIE